MSWCWPAFVDFDRSCLCLPDLNVCFPLQIREIFSYYFFKFSALFLSLLLGLLLYKCCYIWWSVSSLCLFSCCIILLSFLFSVITFLFLSSRSWIHSFASSSLVYTAWILLQILFIELFISNWFFYLFSLCVKGLTDAFYSFLKPTEYLYDCYFKFSISYLYQHYQQQPNYGKSPNAHWLMNW